ncbi:hypothetical protein [Sphingomonas oryzagri]
MVLLACALAWYIMQVAIIRAQGDASPLKRAIGRDWKGRLSPLLYATGIGFAFVAPPVAALFYAGVALLWLAPDRRVHHVLHEATAN